MPFDQAAYHRQKAEEEAQRANWTAFDHFWNSYPQPGRKDKKKVLTLFDLIAGKPGVITRSPLKDSGKIVGMVDIPHDVTAEQLIEASRNYAKEKWLTMECRWDAYVLHATTFLNSGRYEDYL